MPAQSIEPVPSPSLADEGICCRICKTMGICYLVCLLAPLFMLLGVFALALWVFLF